MRFSNKLIELRKKAGLSQEELGNKLNVTRQTVSKWELGETTPEMDKLTTISELFDISLDKLIKDNEPKYNNINNIKYKSIIIILIISLIVLIVFLIFKDSLFKEEENKKLTIGEIKEIAKKGQNISWFDFENYEGEEIGSGLRIIYYEVEGIYDLMIGGTSEYEKPMYVRLFLDKDKEKYVDLLTGNIEDFIKDTKDINTQDANVLNNKEAKKLNQ